MIFFFFGNEGTAPPAPTGQGSGAFAPSAFDDSAIPASAFGGSAFG